jgi:hypothetical protein
MFSAAERESVRVIGRNGRLVFAESGKLVTTTNDSIFVMDTHGNVYIVEAPSMGSVRHSSPVAGADVAAAGTIKVSNGNVYGRIGEQTGHYRDQPAGRSNLVKAELESQGVDVIGVTTDPYIPKK